MKIKLKFYVGLLLLNSAVVLFCMEETNDLYCKRCSAININQEQKLSDFIEKSYKTNPKAAIQKIQHKLVRFEKKIEEKKENMLLEMKNKYKVPEVEWNQYVEEAKIRNDFREKERQVALPNVIHDEVELGSFIVMLKKTLAENGVNPQRYNLQASRNYPYSVGTENISLIRKDNICILDAPPYIAVKLSFLSQLTYKLREALCEYLVNQAINAFINPLHLIEGINSQDNSTIESCNARFLDLTCALKNEYNARLFKMLFRSVYLSPIFTSNHYKQISKIDFLHKALAWLKKYAVEDIEKSLVIHVMENYKNEELLRNGL